MKITKI